MSLSHSLSNALTGLTANSRMAEIVASNTANALTDGYARREVALGSSMLGGEGSGVQINGINRMVNESVLQDHRLADSAVQNASVRTGFYSDFESWIGTPDDSGSLTARVSSLEATLVEASSRPDSEARLQAVFDTASALSNQLNDIDGQLQQTRMNADQDIGKQVNLLNETLGQIDDLNTKIVAQHALGHDASGLMDQRQTLVDRVSEIVPVRQVQRENDKIALFTTGGAILLEDNPTVVGFTPAGVITPDMTQDSGALSGLTLNGMVVSTKDSATMGGGRLGALFALRDEIVPQAQTQVDAVARNLIERFSDPAIDPTLTGGAPGLYTDAGSALDPADEIGLAGRIKINPRVDPNDGGGLWRLRDGIGAATASSDIGNSARLSALVDALNTESVPNSGDFGMARRSATGLASDLLSQVSSQRQGAETTEGFATAREEALKEMVLSDGVDTDQELQTLLLVERAFSANAKVIQTVDALFQQILEI